MRGAQTLAGGKVDAQAHYVAPTLLGDVPADARIMAEEIFGPVLPIVVFEQLDTVIAQINAGPHPLALYLYSQNEAVIQRVLQQTQSGGVCINHALLQFLHGRLPFGGVNNSGLGNAHGWHGFKAFSHDKAVLRSRTRLATRLFLPGAVPGYLRRVLQWAFTRL